MFWNMLSSKNFKAKKKEIKLVVEVEAFPWKIL